MRAEEILDAVVAVLTGLTTTGSRVYRGHVYDLSSAQVPGLVIYMGEDSLDSEVSNSFYNWTLSIIIESKVSSSSAQIDETLNTIRGEVHAALLADYTLGKSFVIDLNPVLANEPVLSGEGSQPIGTQRLEYQIKYRTSRASLSS